ncbi:hypothetical protein ACQQ9V_09210 [Hornefia butyriciproducens]|uniref:hypothetical protein n=1 Tax=Hornefia butyriciproducens TaxID=2652293 RepID=UPI0023F468A8|nr:hypothetical protein [Hornefia butyriciproducens]MCI7327513.1 hypothetical protein [Clostridiales bacterium]MDD6299461.1 hypothetical protein [Hornefia butyriciproducens]MDY2990756.1 hypothetical protein [Hornefia butyriciproducens]
MKTISIPVETGIYGVLPTIILVAYIIAAIALIIAVVVTLVYVRKIYRMMNEHFKDERKPDR